MVDLGQAIKVREEQGGWTLVSDDTDYEVGVVAQRLECGGVPYVLLFVADGLAVLAVPDGDLSDYFE